MNERDNLHQRVGDTRMQIAMASPAAGETDLTFKTPLAHFPNLQATELARLTELTIHVDDPADVALIEAAADGQIFKLEATFREYVAGDTGGAIAHEVTVVDTVTKRDSGEYGLDGVKGPSITMPKGLIVHTLGIKVTLPTTASALGKVAVQAI